MALRVLVTNDDGLWADGLQALYRELRALEGLDLRVVAPDGNRSATGRAITTRRPLRVQEVRLADGAAGWQCDGMPTDCVRLAGHGMLEGWTPQLVVSGINHGANLGDDTTYSGTVSAALESVVHGIPGIAISAASPDGEWAREEDEAWDFGPAARIAARVVDGLAEAPLSERTILNVNVPLGRPTEVEVTRLGRRVYRDELRRLDGPDAEGWSTFTLYGTRHGYEELAGTDLVAIAAGRVSITPLHLDLTSHPALAPLEGHDFTDLLAHLDDFDA